VLSRQVGWNFARSFANRAGVLDDLTDEFGSIWDEVAHAPVKRRCR
jgi:hypothetical protein